MNNANVTANPLALALDDSALPPTSEVTTSTTTVAKPARKARVLEAKSETPALPTHQTGVRKSDCGNYLIITLDVSQKAIEHAKPSSTGKVWMLGHPLAAGMGQFIGETVNVGPENIFGLKLNVQAQLTSGDPKPFLALLAKKSK